jgi:quercetin dioxygenase-like cupin family protein
MNDTTRIRKAEPGFRWQAVDVLAYKPEGSAPFRDITRQLLFRSTGLACELRYFEIAAGGHSTLERHEHEHAVMVLNGRGACLVAGEIRALGPHDLVAIPPLAWHQFRATEGAPLGFLCMVNVDRDRPQLPGNDDLAELKRDPKVAAFIRT